MSVGGPTSLSGECSGVSDVCEYGRHGDCDGEVEHLPLASSWLDPITGRRTYGARRALADHACLCLCHRLARYEDEGLFRRRS